MKSPRDSAINSIRLRPSILSERRPLRDTYCSQRYADGDDAAGTASSNNQDRPSLSQRIIQHQKASAEISDPSSDYPNFIVDPQIKSFSLPQSTKVRLISCFLELG